MPRREIVNPQWAVAVEDAMVVLEFVVPGSKFGALDVKLEPGAAEDMAKVILGAHVLLNEEQQ